MQKIALKIKNKLLEEALKVYLSSYQNPFFEIISSSVEDLSNTILFFDPSSLKETKPEDFPSSYKILIDTGLLDQELIFLILYYKLAGVIEANTPPELIFKCIERVPRGEFWISKNLTKKLCEDYPTYSQKGFSKLTPKEIEIIKLLMNGYSNKKIAVELAISEQTVKCHLNRIFKKLGLNSRAQLIKFSFEKNMIMLNFQPSTHSVKEKNSQAEETCEKAILRKKLLLKRPLNNS